MMSGARKASGRVRLTSPASRSFRRARSRTEDARPVARSSIQRWASAIRVTSFVSGGEDRPRAACITSFASTPRRFNWMGTTRSNSPSALQASGSASKPARPDHLISKLIASTSRVTR